MNTVKRALLATLLAASPALVPAAALAQDVGATVYGNDGNPMR